MLILSDNSAIQMLRGGVFQRRVQYDVPADVQLQLAWYFVNESHDDYRECTRPPKATGASEMLRTVDLSVAVRG
jgi:hypothetical protein